MPQVDVQLALDADAHAVDITAQAHCTAQTGVEMEALTAAAVAALTVYALAAAYMRIQLVLGASSPACSRVPLCMLQLCTEAASLVAEQAHQAADWCS